ncbi:TPA: retron Eco8 family effector endonuclease [Photobacterium damselae]
MTIDTIKIKNILSFDYVEINDINNINAIIGKNNVGKSNLFKALSFFYKSLDGITEKPIGLNSKYSPYGEIEITYDLRRIRKIVRSNHKNVFFRHIYNTMFDDSVMICNLFFDLKRKEVYKDKVSIKLTIHSNGKVEWSEKNKDVLGIISYIFPFLEIDARHINLHNWDSLWGLISRIKSFKVSQISKEEVRESIDELLCDNSNEFVNFISLIEQELNIRKYSSRDKLTSLIKVSLSGDTFYSSGDSPDIQSDGTNSFNYIDSALKLLILITRREYISPIIYIDEPEVGLHPKRCELLINNLSDIIEKSKFSKSGRKVNTPLPTFFFSTHSPNIIKEIIKNFDKRQNVYHLRKDRKDNTDIILLKSQFSDLRFINKFSDNEARLFFSDFIIFVEGASELELFGNVKLKSIYPKLRDVDIYQNSDNSLTEAINPSSTNAAIPYLYLYDVDKAFYFRNNNVEFKKTSSIVNLQKEYLLERLNRLNKGYSKKYKYYKSRVDKILYFHDKSEFIFDTSLAFPENKKKFLLMRSVVQEYLLLNKVYLLNDTIEGVLITNHSKDIFYKWLYEYRSINIYPVVKLFKNNTEITNKELIKTIFPKGPKIDVVLSEDHLIQYLKLMFKGKLYSQSSKNNKNVVAIKESLTELTNIKEEDKTSGWITSFINYSIDDLRRKSRSYDELVSNFIRHFPELNDIINKIYER